MHKAPVSLNTCIFISLIYLYHQNKTKNRKMETFKLIIRLVMTIANTVKYIGDTIILVMANDLWLWLKPVRQYYSWNFRHDLPS